MSETGTTTVGLGTCKEHGRVECDLCMVECDAPGCVSTAWYDDRTWYFGPPHPSDGIGDTLCPVHAVGADVT